jgi:acyl-[acyl-carrier-protein]-phospholipid O-acyltransferase/long-chain-fatty-acid--[acyl-carrier-protein] ligase
MISIIAKAFFWFAGSLQILIIIPLGLTQFGLSKTMTSVLVVIELVGIAAGSLLAPFLSKGPKWYRVLAPASFVMAGGMFVVALVPHLPAFTHKITVISTLAVLGIAGGIFSIPVTSFVQVRPAPEFKGRMIASSNFADFIGILLSGVIFYILEKMQISPANCFFIEGLMVTATSVWLLLVLGKEKIND